MKIKMNSKTKILIGILVVGIVLIGRWFILNECQRCHLTHFWKMGSCDRVGLPLPVTSSEEAIKLIGKEYLQLAEATDNFTGGSITSIKEIENGRRIQIHWGWCPDCFCVFNVYKNGITEKLEEGNCPYEKQVK